MVGDFCKGGVTIHCLNKQNMLAESLLLISFLSVSSKWGVTRHPFHPPGSAAPEVVGSKSDFFFCGFMSFLKAIEFRRYIQHISHSTFKPLYLPQQTKFLIPHLEALT